MRIQMLLSVQKIIKLQIYLQKDSIFLLAIVMKHLMLLSVIQTLGKVVVYKVL